MRYYIFLLLLICFSKRIEGQNTFNNRFHFGFPAAVLCSVIPTDSCYYATGIIADSVFPYNTGSIFTKLDLNGLPVNNRTIRSTEKTYETWFDDLQILPDGGFILQAYSYDSTAKTILIRLNKFGDTLFTREFLNPNYPASEFIQPRGGLCRTPDGGYIISNWISSSDINPDIYLIKTDSLGNKIWSKRFGDMGWDRPQSLLATPEGNIIIGAIRTNNNTAAENYIYQCHIFQTDSLGNVEWNYYTPVSLGLRDAAYDMVLLDDGSLVVTSGLGTEYERPSLNVVWFEKMVFKLNNNHQIAWEQDFTELQPTQFTQLTHLVKPKDNSGFVLAGTAPFIIQNPNDNKWGMYGWIGKISNSSTKLWERRYQYLTTDQWEHQIFDIKETPDEGFIICGQALDWTADSLLQQAWLLKLDKHGCLVPGCHLTDAAGEMQREIQLAIYPNPTSDYLNFYLRTPNLSKSGVFRIVNAEGRLMQEFETAPSDVTYMIPVWDWAAGVYFLQYLDNGVVIHSEKFIKK